MAPQQAEDEEKDVDMNMMTKLVSITVTLLIVSSNKA